MISRREEAEVDITCRSIQQARAKTKSITTSLEEGMDTIEDEETIGVTEEVASNLTIKERIRRVQQLLMSRLNQLPTKRLTTISHTIRSQENIIKKTIKPKTTLIPLSRTWLQEATKLCRQEEKRRRHPPIKLDTGLDSQTEVEHSEVIEAETTEGAIKNEEWNKCERTRRAVKVCLLF